MLQQRRSLRSALDVAQYRRRYAELYNIRTLHCGGRWGVAASLSSRAQTSKPNFEKKSRGVASWRHACLPSEKAPPETSGEPAGTGRGKREAAVATLIPVVDGRALRWQTASLKVPVRNTTSISVVLPTSTTHYIHTHPHLPQSLILRVGASCLAGPHGIGQCDCLVDRCRLDCILYLLATHSSKPGSTCHSTTHTRRIGHGEGSLSRSRPRRPRSPPFTFLLRVGQRPLQPCSHVSTAPSTSAHRSGISQWRDAAADQSQTQVGQFRPRSRAATAASRARPGKSDYESKHIRRYCRGCQADRRTSP
jgi:hypothetical protein